LLITSSWLLAAFLYFVSDYVAAFYRQPGIGQVLRVLTISFLLMPFGSYLYALLARNLQSGKQAIVSIVGNVAYAITCVSLAYLGYTYMALAWANVVNVSVSIIAYLYLRPAQTTFLPSLRNWRGPIQFGSGAILGNLINQTANAAPDLILGRTSGPHDVGLYSRANGLVGIFHQIFGPTINYHAVPYIASHHHASEPLGPMISKSASYLTGLAWPAFILTAVFASQIIHILYGAVWVEAAPIVVLICIQTAGRIGYDLCEPGLLAIGKPYLSAISSGITLLARVLLIYLLGAGDVMTFAIALCIADLVVLPVPAVLMAKYLDYSTGQAARAFLPSAKVAIACLVCTLLLKLAIPSNWPDVLVLLVAGVACVTTWATSILYFRHPLVDEFAPVLRKLLPVALADRAISMIEQRAPRA
jgi:O-antigen/teichoic acid export membrane protein